MLSFYVLDTVARSSSVVRRCELPPQRGHDERASTNRLAFSGDLWEPCSRMRCADAWQRDRGSVNYASIN
jgi:hypothetical protein